MRSSNALVSALALCCVYENSTTEISWLSWCSDPITGIDCCCARAASGHVAAPPTSVMNSRRLIVAPRGQNHARHRLTAVRVLERGEGDVSCDQLFWAGNVGSGSHDPVKTGKAQNQANVFRFAPEADLLPDLRTTPPPAFRERRHPASRVGSQPCVGERPSWTV